MLEIVYGDSMLDDELLHVGRPVRRSDKPSKLLFEIQSDESDEQKNKNSDTGGNSQVFSYCTKDENYIYNYIYSKDYQHLPVQDTNN